ncbi:ATP-binding protein [Pseudomonas sp. UFMG81]|uniref:ATP-binding protein n=1 Tax=Pseudomonas sp. UFMG81 TaxID=2745936 RepID=UPI00188DED81|nr:ATP-binding protein [Pseudomonas sp. UFMG81]
MTSVNGFPPQTPSTLATATPAESSDIDLLHGISVALIGEQDSAALYGRIIDAAIAITGSHFATMQLHSPEGGGSLKLLCSRGLAEDAVRFWQWVSPTALSSCALALRQGRRAVIADFEQWAEIAGTEELQAFRRAGIRAAQTTPLLSRDGRLLGMISNHWREPHHPSERVLRLLDILARTAADLLERTIAEEQQRRTAAELRTLNDTLEQRVTERTRELMQVEERLRQSQKMEAVGQLTGGLAHDFNNLLGNISGALELLQQRLAEGRAGEAGRYLGEAQGSVRRAAALTHRLLAFSRRQTLEPRPLDINALMHGLGEMVQRTIGPGIVLETIDNTALWPALVDAGQLENALLNLCLNARDAMPEGGRITLRAVNRSLADSVDELPAGDYLCLSVADTGSGMPPEVLAHVFEPFYTTKPIGQGTGLGLSMIYGFAQQSGGQVRIESRVGEGTTVFLYLPRHQGEALVPVPSDEAAVQAGRQGQTILLVEDEPTLRMLTAEVLREHGYRVLEAGDSTLGLQVLRGTEHLDLLLTDVGLPGGMNGRQLADAGRELRPGLRTLFITGYVQHTVGEDGLLAPGMQVLTKPFSLEALVRRVGVMLVVDHGGS